MCLYTFHHTADEIAILRIQIRGPICLGHCASREVLCFGIKEIEKWPVGVLCKSQITERERRGRENLRGK